MVNCQKKKEQIANNSKFQILSFFNNFGRELPYEYYEFGGINLVYFQWRYRLKLLLPYGTMLAKTEKKIVKNPKFEI